MYLYVCMCVSSCMRVLCLHISAFVSCGCVSMCFFLTKALHAAGEQGKTKSGLALHYKGTKFFHSNSTSVTGGDLSGKGDGESIYGKSFADENFQVKHDGTLFL